MGTIDQAASVAGFGRVGAVIWRLAFDEFSLVKLRSGSHEADQMRGVDGVPAGWAASIISGLLIVRPSSRTSSTRSPPPTRSDPTPATSTRATSSSTASPTTPPSVSRLKFVR